MKSLVVAYDRDRGIGIDHDLPWGRDLSSDLRHFRALTLGKSVIMGRTTFDEIGILPGRENIVVTSRRIDADVVAVRGLAEAYRRAKHEPVVIGGSSIYQQALHEGMVDTVYATEVDAVFPGVDRFFPELPGEWHETAREVHEPTDLDKYGFAFVTYVSDPLQNKQAR